MANDLLLKLPKYVIGGWKEVRLTRGIERCPNDFDISLTELYPSEASQVVVQPGDAVEVLIDKDLTLTGYIDRVMRSMSGRSHEVAVSGRGKCQDLVDCSALWDGNQITNSDILQVAQKLAAPYGVNVSRAAGQDVGLPIPMFNFGLGETAFSIIENMCRFRSFLAYELPSGALHLRRVDSRRAGGALREGVNVEEAYVVQTMDDRYSHYDSFLNSVDLFSDAGEGGNVLKTVRDAGVPRYRHKYVHVEAPKAMGEDVMLARARWEANRRVGRSFQVRVTTDTWRDSAGALYEPNTLIEVDLPSLKVTKQDMLIGEVTYRKDGSGTHCDLTLMPPTAFDVAPATYPGWLDVQPLKAP